MHSNLIPCYNRSAMPTDKSPIPNPKSEILNFTALRISYNPGTRHHTISLYVFLGSFRLARIRMTGRAGSPFWYQTDRANASINPKLQPTAAWCNDLIKKSGAPTGAPKS